MSDEGTATPNDRGASAARPAVARGWFLHALLYVAAVRLALRLLPFRTTRRLLRRLGSWIRLPAVADPVARARAALDAASGRVPGGGNCFVRALALQALLAHRGVVAELRVGFLPGADGRPEGHAWLERDGRVLVGEVADLDGFRRSSSRF